MVERILSTKKQTCLQEDTIQTKTKETEEYRQNNEKVLQKEDKKYNKRKQTNRKQTGDNKTDHGFLVYCTFYENLFTKAVYIDMDLVYIM